MESIHKDFSAQYRSRWGGSPLTTSYYYDDSAAMWALAVEAAGHDQGDPPSAQAVAQRLREVSAPPGEGIEWNDLARSFDLVRQGMDIDYRGLTGSLDIAASGEATQNSLRFWGISGGSIHYDAPSDYSQTLSPQCP